MYRFLKIKTLSGQAILGELPEGVLPPALLLTLCPPPHSTGGELYLEYSEY